MKALASGDARTENSGMDLTKRFIASLVLSATVAGVAGVASVASVAAAATASFDAAGFEQWRAGRLAALTSGTGWLTLVGLYWFREGPNTIGQGRSNTIAIDNPALGRRAGRFVVDGTVVRFEAAPKSCVRIDGKPVTRQVLTADKAGEPELLSCGSLEFYVIERGGKLGLRVRDIASRARREFRGLDYFPFDPLWVVDARFEPYAPPRHVPIVNVLGMELDMLSPGALVFEHDGREWRLDALLEDPDADTLFVMFADGTSSRETYGAGRFLYVPLPVAGHVTVDFNRAHSPPCAFTPFATCPLPPEQNRIALRVAAGELRYAGAEH